MPRGRGRGRAPRPNPRRPPPRGQWPGAEWVNPGIGWSNARRARPQSGARVAVKSNCCLHLLLLLSRCGGQRFNRRYSCPKPCRLRMVWKPPHPRDPFELSLGRATWSVRSFYKRAPTRAGGALSVGPSERPSLRTWTGSPNCKVLSGTGPL